MMDFDNYKMAVEALSGGKNTVLFDDLGLPSVMCILPKMSYADVIEGGTQETLPCFIVDGVEKEAIYVSKFQNIIKNERAYSLPMQDPTIGITFDWAIQVCRNKGDGWGLCPGNAWAAAALWAKKNNTLPRGNNNRGCNNKNTYEKGLLTLSGAYPTSRTATGSGPVTWNHNHTDSGIADMNGNVWEWNAGIRLMAGEIQVIPDANCMKKDCSMTKNSIEWKAIMPDGTLVVPGTTGTLKFNGTVAGTTSTNESRIGGQILDVVCDKPAYTGTDAEGQYGYLLRTFGSIGASTGVTVPQLLKAYGVYPDAGDITGDGAFVRNYGERLMFRGGGFESVDLAGAFAFNLSRTRDATLSTLGFRSAYYSL